MEEKRSTVEVMKNMNNCEKQNEEENEEEGPLPGFRFHPTDEELVGFYLKRKVENKRPLSIQIIKQIDIYKHDPWDLAKGNSSVGDKEWYFYCKRGRKYRNSIRPNRVTGSGFWKATGIDKPVYSNHGGEGPVHHCIGLKKSLVYYRGSAGKGTKTDWMMHEFRLPSELQQLHDQPYVLSNPKDTTGQEAEIWTLCRIFKRNKRQSPDWRELSARKNAMTINSSSKTSSLDSTTNNNQSQHYISFTTHPNQTNINTNYDPQLVNNHNNINMYFHLNDRHQQQQQQQWSSVVFANTPSTTSTYSSSLNNLAIEDEKDMESFGYYGHNWDDLSSVVELAVKSPLV